MRVYLSAVLPGIKILVPRAHEQFVNRLFAVLHLPYRQALGPGTALEVGPGLIAQISPLFDRARDQTKPAKYKKTIALDR